MNEGFANAHWAKLEAAGIEALKTFAQQRIKAIRENISIPVERQGSYVIRSKQGEYPRLDHGDLWRSIKATDPVSMDHVIDIFLYTDVLHAVFLEYKEPDDGGRPWWGPSFQEMVDHQNDLKVLFFENLGSFASTAPPALV